MNIDKNTDKKTTLGFEDLAKIMSGNGLFDRRKIKFYTDELKMSRKSYESSVVSSHSFYRERSIPFQISYGTDDSRGVLGLLHIALITGNISSVTYKLYSIDRHMIAMKVEDRSGILGDLEKALSSLIGKSIDLENTIISQE